MRFFLLYISLIILCFSCEKEIDVDLTLHDEQRIIGEGFFTDQLNTQYFSFGLSNNLGTGNAGSLNDVEFSITTPDGKINYTKIDSQNYASEIPFQGIPGENYTLTFSHKGTEHTITTKMPFPVEFTQFSFQKTDALVGPIMAPEIYLTVNSNVPQYLKFDLFKADPSSLILGDTAWIQTPLPIYQITKIPLGENVQFKLPIDATDGFWVESGDLIKIETSILHEQIANYLFDLQNYITQELANSQFHNPPFYYTNEAYGLGYGTIKNEIIHQY